jgi:D-3-phosphoglycerate dehydrogenase / 2-oxoglutarate reductase
MSVLIVEPSGYSTCALDRYRKLGRVWLGDIPSEKEEQVRLLVVRLAYLLDKEFLSKYPNLIAISTPTTGLTHIDLNTCRQKNIRIFSLAECRQAIEEVTSTSELTIGLMLSLLRRIPIAHYDVIHQNRWDRDRFRSRQLSRLTLGIIGLGRIGGHVAHYARALGMRVLAYDPYQDISRFIDHDVKQCDLAALLKESDIVSIHANLREDNFNMIAKAEIDLLKKDALLINTARGALLDEATTAKALRYGELGGVAIDVLSDEHTDSPCLNSPLVSAAKDGFNIIITPHIGGCTIDAMHITEERLAEVVVRELGEKI